MEIYMGGTRGSCGVSGTKMSKYGAQTTSLRVKSSSLPNDCWFIIDAGTGILPIGYEFAKAYFAGEVKRAVIGHSHFHPDHTQGLPLSTFPYLGNELIMFGPREKNMGVGEFYADLMQAPKFPVDYHKHSSRFKTFDITEPKVDLLVLHPLGGYKQMTLDKFERIEREGKQVPFGRNRYALQECLVVRFYQSHHPQKTLSFRLEERSTGQVFVFMTDHENEDGIPGDLRAFLSGIDLLVIDCQYTDEKYRKMTVGWGHGTPTYVASLAREIGIPWLGLTHHDPPATDEDIDKIVGLVQAFAPQTRVFGCYDGQDIDLAALRQQYTTGQTEVLTV